jgi:hypothetical protein
MSRKIKREGVRKARMVKEESKKDESLDGE